MYPQLHEIESTREMIDVFRGYNHNSRVGDGEFFDMKNMTSDHYPVASPRKGRGVYTKCLSPQGMIAKDSLCYVDGTEFVMNEYHVDMGLSIAEDDCPKQLISMGAYVIIMPDKKWINTLDLTDFGNIDASFVTSADITFTLCTIDGAAYEDVTVSSSEPSEPANMDLWIDTSSTPHSLKQWSSTNAMWVAIATTYVKISSPGIGKAFGQYDGVTISGITKEGLTDLNSTAVVWDRDEDYIVVVGIVDVVGIQTAAEGSVKVERKMPSMDYVIESKNRLWGCKYGIANNGEVVNEIYASKLGDFKNWNCFMGISTDSYVVSVGSDGQWTGAISHLGHPCFFKETILHKMYGDFPANFSLQDTICRGVQKGCHDSLAIVNETLYYKARSGICAYDGSLPTEVSYALGNEQYGDAVGGAHGNKYYVSMKNNDGERVLFVYDTSVRQWHKEDDLDALAFCSCRGEMYAIDKTSKQIMTLLGSADKAEDDVEWMVETGDIGLNSPDMKYISRLTLRVVMNSGAFMEIYAQYDLMDEWEHLCRIDGSSLRSFSVPVRPRRCDNLKLRIIGKGTGKIYSITKTIEQGSELS